MENGRIRRIIKRKKKRIKKERKNKSSAVTIGCLGRRRIYGNVLACHWYPMSSLRSFSVCFQNDSVQRCIRLIIHQKIVRYAVMQLAAPVIDPCIGYFYSVKSKLLATSRDISGCSYGLLPWFFHSWLRSLAERGLVFRGFVLRKNGMYSIYAFSCETTRHRTSPRSQRSMPYQTFTAVVSIRRYTKRYISAMCGWESCRRNAGAGCLDALLAV